MAAAAAVLLMACAFTVVTGLDQRLLDFLGGTPKEETLLSRAAVPVDASATDLGVTMEVKQVLADSYSVLFLVEFTAPEHVVLNQDSCTFGTTYYNFINEAGESLTRTTYSHHWYPVSQEDPADNHLEMICLITSNENTVVANAGGENDYESFLTQQNITGIFFSVRAALSDSRQGAANDSAPGSDMAVCSSPFPVSGHRLEDLSSGHFPYSERKRGPCNQHLSLPPHFESPAPGDRPRYVRCSPTYQRGLAGPDRTAGSGGNCGPIRPSRQLPRR